MTRCVTVFDRRSAVKDIDDQKATAAYLGVPHRTLEDWRYRSVGPRYLKVGRVVRYRRADVDAWLAARVVTPNREVA